MPFRFTQPAGRPWLVFAVDPATQLPGGITQPAQGTPEPPAQQTPAGQAPPAQPPGDGTAPAGGPEDADTGGEKPNDKRVVAELARERKRRQALEQQLSGFTSAIKQLAGEPGDDGDEAGSDVERLVNRIAALEQQAETNRVEALRMKVASETGVPADLAEFLTATDEDSLRTQAQKLVAATAAATGPKRPNPDPAQGAKPQADQLSELDARINQALEAGDVRTSIALKRQRAALASR